MAKLSDTSLGQQLEFIRAAELAEVERFSITGASSSSGQYGEQVRYIVALPNGEKRALTLSATAGRTEYITWFANNPGQQLDDVRLVSVKTKNGQDFWQFTDADEDDAASESDVDIPF